LGHLIARMLAEDTKKASSVNDKVFSSNGSCSSNSTVVQNMYSGYDSYSNSKRSTPTPADATGDIFTCI
jgi:hypothetical protein